jgi:signal transduction histidine kinase
VTEGKQAALELRMTVNALHRAIEAKEQLEADLHDGTLQSLYGAGLQLEAARAALGKDAAAHLDPAVKQIRSTMAEIRRYIAAGSGALPTSVPWNEALTGLLRGLEVDGGPTIEMALDRQAIGRVSGPSRSELAFIAREAVSNAVRHAAAKRIVVRLLDDGAQIRLEIEDDGAGFPTRPRRGGLGLLTMTRRAAQIGGSLRVQTEPGSGTLLRLDLPVADPEGDHA